MGYGAASVAEEAPFLFPRISTRPDLPEVPFGQASWAFEDATVDLLDFDGDGWLDVLEVANGRVLRYWPRLRGRGEGWDSTPVEVSDGTPALVSTSASRGWVAEETEGEVHYDTWTVDVPAIAFMDATTGFRDLNGDGAMDFVDTREHDPAEPGECGWGEWRVWLGDGAGDFGAEVVWPAPVGWIARTDEGQAYVESCSVTPQEVELGPAALDQTLTDVASPPETAGGGCSRRIGRSQSVVGGLLDVDGDGRMDLVHGEASMEVGAVVYPGRWYRNSGDGFECVPRSAPDWMPVATVRGPTMGTSAEAVVLSSSWTSQKVVASGDPTDPSESAAQFADLQQDLLVADVDQDGLPDVIDLRDPNARVVRYSGRHLDGEGIPVGYRPGLLARVDTGTGAWTTFAWRSSAVEYPSGRDLDGPEVSDPVGTPIRKDLVAEMGVGDPVSAWEGRRLFRYRDGRVEDGRWLGFESVAEVDWSNSGRLAFNPGIDEAFLGRTLTYYELDRDWALPASRTIDDDRNLSWYYGQDPGDETLSFRHGTAWNYADHGAEEPRSRWLEEIVVTEYSAPRDVGVPETHRSFTVTIGYDAVGNVVSQSHDADDRDQDRVDVATDWVASADGAIWRPSHNETWSSRLELTAALDMVESADFGWDGGALGLAPTAGLLTHQAVCANEDVASCGALDQLDWVFLRTARGAVSEIQAPAGRDTFNDAFDFGETTVTELRNALSHLTTRAVDDLGRVVEETDPNDVVHRTTFDAFGRTVLTEVRGAGAAAFRTVTETTWHDDDVPRWSETVTHTGAGPTTTSYVVFDGFGRELQTWSPADSGWVVVEKETDVRGNLRWVSEPHVEAAFVVDYDATKTSASSSYSYVDLFGEPVVTLSDSDGLVLLDHPEPGSTRYRYAEGHERVEVHDTHGRVVEVWQGRPDAGLVLTGSYVYDGLDRVVKFTDGNENAWKYDFDGTGRLRQVWRQPPGAGPTWTPYYAYEWDGPDPITMIEGDPDVASPVVAVEWEYDLLGRTVEKRVADPVAPSGALTFTWTWDGQWIGERDAVADAYGEVTYTYAPDVDFGGFGWPTTVSREWTDTTTATFDYAYDAEGHVVSATWPSGTVVESAYHPNGWPAGNTVDANGSELSVFHTYDTTWGLPSGWVATLMTSPTAKTYAHTISRANPSRIGALSWVEGGGASHSITYGWYANGWLEKKTIDALDPIAYTYDHLGRISGIWNDTTSAPFEEYTYDTIGNPVSFVRTASPTVSWEYANAPQFNEIASRVRAGGTVVDDMTYDPVTGRLLSWDNTGGNNVARDYAYDGSGRLRQIGRSTGGGPVKLTRLRYDVDDQIVQEVTNAGAVTSIHRFSGWRKEMPTGRVIESILPMVRLEDGSFRVLYLEPNGNAVWTDDNAAAPVDSFEVSGAYGLPLSGYTSGTPWVMDHLHGAEPDRDDEVVHFGARHMLLRDGLWMQPEPLLHLGITSGDLTNPLAYGGLYAAGNTNSFMDVTGYITITEKGLKDNPSPETLEPSQDLVSGMKNLEAGTAARQNDHQDPGFVATGRKPENSQELEIPTGGGEARLVGPVDTTSVSGSSPPGGGNNGHGHGFGTVVGPSTNSNPAFAGRPNDESSAIAVAAASPQGIGLVMVANGPKDGSTRTLGAVTAVRTSDGIVVSQYAGRANQADNTAVLVRVGTPQTVPLPGAP